MMTVIFLKENYISSLILVSKSIFNKVFSQTNLREVLCCHLKAILGSLTIVTFDLHCSNEFLFFFLIITTKLVPEIPLPHLVFNIFLCGLAATGERNISELMVC